MPAFLEIRETLEFLFLVLCGEPMRGPPLVVTFRWTSSKLSERFEAFGARPISRRMLSTANGTFGRTVMSVGWFPRSAHAANGKVGLWAHVCAMSHATAAPAKLHRISVWPACLFATVIINTSWHDVSEEGDQGTLRVSQHSSVHDFHLLGTKPQMSFERC